MKSVACLLSLLVLFPALSLQSALEDCVKNFDANKDCFTYKSTVNTASLFEVEYRNYYKVVRAKQTGGPTSTYVLVIRGATPPSLPNVNGTFNIPVNKAGVLDTTVITMLEAIGARTAIQGAEDDSVTSACYQKLKSEGKTLKVNSQNQTAAVEQLKADDVIYSSTAVTGLENSTVATYATSDPAPLKRAEWIKYVAQFFGSENTADQVHNEITSRYNCVKDVAQSLKTTGASVAWISYSSYQGSVSYSISSAPYKQIYVEDAGGKFVNSTKSLYSATELDQFKNDLKDVDVVIDESFVGTDSPQGFLETFKFDDSFKFVKNQQVYRIDRRQSAAGAFDWFESAVLFANAVLEDISSITKPNSMGSSFVRRYLRNIYNEQIVTVTRDACVDDPAAPLAVVGMTCSDLQKVASSESNMLGVSALTFIFAAAVAAFFI